MRNHKLHKLFNHLATICLITLSLQVYAKPEDATQSAKEKVILLPLVVSEDTQSMLSQMQAAVVQGLEQKYFVYSGERVLQELKKAADKENHAAKQDCDETRCLQDIATAFQTENVAVVHISKVEGGYLLSLSIKGVISNEAVFDNSLPCEGCSVFKVIDKLKDLSGTAADIDRQLREAEIAQKANEGKLKAEQIKQAELTAEQRQKEIESAEYQQMLASQADDAKRVADLKVQAEARHKSISVKQAGKFPTVLSAVTEIKRLNDRIETIEAGYEKQLTETINKINRRYAAQLDTLNKAKKSEFETDADFKADQDKKRTNLQTQKNVELANIPTLSSLASAETTPLHESINELAEREYGVGMESLTVEIGTYDANTQQFPVTINTKTPAFKLAISGKINISKAVAKSFKQQWQAGLLRAEAKTKPSGEAYDLVLLNDADNVRRTNESGMFLTDAEKESARLAKIAQEEAEKKRREEWVRNAPQREAEAKKRKEDEKEKKLDKVSFFMATKEGLHPKNVPDNYIFGVSGYYTIWYTTALPVSLLVDIISAPTKTSEIVKIETEAALHPSTWAKPDSMIARASRQFKEVSFTTGNVPLAVATE